MPFKTIQAAINEVFLAQELLFQANVPTAGIVYALPGIYGPTGSGDVFPITMRDRVNLQGLGGQSCILREVSPNNVPFLPISPPVGNFFLPTSPSAPPGLFVSGVVLLDFSSASPTGPSLLSGFAQPPWNAEADSFELFDGFTLQGGDIQIMFWAQPGLGFVQRPTHARITNCILDLRHGWFAEPDVLIDGPYIGIEMAKRHTVLTGFGIRGYPEQYVLIAHNTFILGGRSFAASGDAWIRCRQGTVGVIDCNDPQCGSGVPDCEGGQRGVGSPGIYNNIFRSAPPLSLQTVQPMAMLGIDAGDTTLYDILSSSVRETNAFDPLLSGGSSYDNGWFKSVPMVPVVTGIAQGLVLVNSGTPVPSCGTGACNVSVMPPGSVVAPATTPIVPIFDGTNGVDPCFVGEFLNDQNLIATVPGVLTRYDDWRLMPGSPMADRGVVPIPSIGSTGLMYCSMAPALYCFSESLCALLQSTDWDCEEYGNPRGVDSAPDLGADETHGYLSAGSYGSGSKSHNNPAVGLSPSAAQGRPFRQLIMRQSASQQLIVIHGKATLSPVPTPPNPPSPQAWTQPPGTLTPAIVGPAPLPRDSKKQWITFSDPTTPPDPTPTPWRSGVMPPIWTYRPSWIPVINQALISFCREPQLDDEAAFAVPVAPASFGTYFGSQLVMYTLAGVQVYWSNFQFEYR